MVIFISLDKNKVSSNLYIHICPQSIVYITQLPFWKKVKLKLKDFLGYFKIK